MFAAVAVLTLGVAIGASVSLFSVFDQVVLNPAQVPRPASLVAIWAFNPKLNASAPAVSWVRYERIRAETTAFESIGISAFDAFNFTGNGDPVQLAGLRVSSTFLPTLGVMPAAGRNFSPDEDVPNGANVCIISHEFWQSRFAGRAGILNTPIMLNGQPWQIVGIMPPHTGGPFAAAQIFAPRVFDISALTHAQIDAGATFAQPIARLKPGATLTQAAHELDAVNTRYAAEFVSRLDATHQAQPRNFVDALVGGIQPTFYALIGAVSLVLLIACANVSSLFIGRLSASQKEIAMRQALGASRSQIVRRFLIESLALSAAAGALGLVIALASLSAVRSLIGTLLPTNVVLSLNWQAFGLAGGLIGMSALFVGLLPALQASKPSLTNALHDSARGSTGVGRRSRGVLMAGEVALAMVLLVGSSLLVTSLNRLNSVQPGFEPRSLATAFVNVSADRYKTPPEQAEFFERVFGALERDPSVTDAASAIGLPFSGFIPSSSYQVEGRPILPFAQRPLSGLSIVSENYFRLMQIGIVRGRAFQATDRAGAPGVCVINESLAHRLFPDESPLGKVMLRGTNADQRFEVVGVSRDVKTNGLTAPTPDEIYFPMRQFGRPGMNVIARTTGDPAALERALRTAVASIDPDQPISFFTTMEQSIASSVGTQRIVASLTTVFGGLSLVLSVIGLYSVLAYIVSQRRREIGIRIALGASKAEVLGLMMRSGLRPVAAGIVIGLAGAAGTGQLIRSLLFSVQPGNLTVYVVVTLTFVIVAALACLIPSIRASNVDPLVALRDS